MLKRIIYISFIFIGYTLPGITQSIVINEAMFSNKSSHTDSFDKTPDWVELYNPTTSYIQLRNWKLIDDTTKSEYWIFPDTLIAPFSYIIVYASGKNIKADNLLHTHFKLSSVNEGIYLFNPQNHLISHIAAQCVPTDLSIGCTLDGNQNYTILSPSPGKSNNNATTHTISHTPTTIFIQQESGIFTTDISVSITTLSDKVSIHYTTNGEEPDETSEIYTGPITISNRTADANIFSNIRTSDFWEKPQSLVFKATTLRAVAYSSGCIASPIVNKTYIIHPNIQQKYPHVPIISIITNPDNLFDKTEGIYVKGNDLNYFRRGKQWERDATIHMFDTTGILVLNQDIGIRLNGEISRISPQKSLRLYAKEKYGTATFSYPFFSQKAHIHNYSTLILRAARDGSFALFKEELCHALVQNMNMDYRATSTAIVFINGEYWGIHSIQEFFDEEYFMKNYTTTNSQYDIISYVASKGPEANTGNMKNFNKLIEYLSLHNLAEQEYYKTACTMIDIANLTDYYIAQMYFANSDFPKKNLKMWLPLDSDTSKWRYLFFDCDECMTRTHYNLLDEYNHTLEPYMKYPEWATIILRSFFQNEEFRTYFSQRALFHLHTTFNPDRVIQKIEEFETFYEPLVHEHTLRWKYPVDYTKWKHNVAALKTFAMQRPSVFYKELLANLEFPFTIYPNPTVESKGFRIQNSAIQESGCNTVIVDIFSLTGTQVYSEITNSCNLAEKTFTPIVPTGIYTIRIGYQGFLYTSNIVYLE